MHDIVRKAALERRNKSSEFSDKSLEISDAMRLVHLVAEPRHVDDSIKAAITRASRKLGWAVSRTREIWYGTARRIDAREMDALRRIERERLAADFVAERKRYTEQLLVLRARLSMRDPQFHAPDIAALDWMLREAGVEV